MWRQRERVRACVCVSVSQDKKASAAFRSSTDRFAMRIDENPESCYTFRKDEKVAPWVRAVHATPPPA